MTDVIVVGAGLAGLACARRLHDDGVRVTVLEAGWRRLRTDRIADALPAQPPGRLEPPARPVRLGDRRYVASDHRDTASIEGAVVSGWRAAGAVLEDLDRLVGSRHG